jgi:hypothetical protein
VGWVGGWVGGANMCGACLPCSCSLSYLPVCLPRLPQAPCSPTGRLGPCPAPTSALPSPPLHLRPALPLPQRNPCPAGPACRASPGPTSSWMRGTASKTQHASSTQSCAPTPQPTVCCSRVRGLQIESEGAKCSCWQ